MFKIDKSKWKRRETYNNFIKYTNPVFSVGTRLDITELLKYCEEKQKRFFPTFLYFVTQCLNEIEELRTRITGDDVVVFERINPSYIVMLENEELVTCVSQAKEDFAEFYTETEKNIDTVRKNNTAYFNKETCLDCVYISCLPWTDFTSVINPYNFNDKSGTSIPRITWGKYSENAKGRMEIAIDVSAHHALIDGRQISRFYEKMQETLSEPEGFLGGRKDER